MRRARKSINQINVVPYIDVMLVLLVIFMVTAPLIIPGEIELPSVGSKLTTPAQPFEVTLRNDLTLWLRDQASNTPAVRVTRERSGQHLDGHVAPELHVLRAIDFAHPARAERSDNLVRTQRRAFC